MHIVDDLDQEWGRLVFRAVIFWHKTAGSGHKITEQSQAARSADAVLQPAGPLTQPTRPLVGATLRLLGARVWKFAFPQRHTPLLPNEFLAPTFFFRVSSSPRPFGFFLSVIK